ncbi:hypothetical protein [Streptomyces sp. NPDC058108]|uniref:hypothetical protein n=1 Tax=Streptomyces sp. NPDC058108 TaxID=3346344 RepID=UPI0036E279AD
MSTLANIDFRMAREEVIEFERHGRSPGAAEAQHREQCRPRRVRVAPLTGRRTPGREPVRAAGRPLRRKPIRPGRIYGDVTVRSRQRRECSHSCGPWRDTDGEYLDVEAAISFTQAFQDQRGGGDCGLHWAGTSGWCLYTADKEDRYLSGAR